MLARAKMVVKINQRETVLVVRRVGFYDGKDILLAAVRRLSLYSLLERDVAPW